MFCLCFYWLGTLCALLLRSMDYCLCYHTQNCDKTFLVVSALRFTFASIQWYHWGIVNTLALVLCWVHCYCDKCISTALSGLLLRYVGWCCNKCARVASNFFPIYMCYLGCALHTLDCALSNENVKNLKNGERKKHLIK